MLLLDLYTYIDHKIQFKLYIGKIVLCVLLIFGCHISIINHTLPSTVRAVISILLGD